MLISCSGPQSSGSHLTTTSMCWIRTPTLHGWRSALSPIYARTMRGNLETCRLTTVLRNSTWNTGSHWFYLFRFCLNRFLIDLQRYCCGQTGALYVGHLHIRSVSGFKLRWKRELLGNVMCNQAYIQSSIAQNANNSWYELFASSIYF